MRHPVRERPPLPRMERRLAALLHYGTGFSAAWMAFGMVLDIADRALGRHLLPLDSVRVMSVGVALLILLPVARVALMLGLFVREKDYRFAGIAAAVLCIILLGVWLGIRH